MTLVIKEKAWERYSIITKNPCLNSIREMCMWNHACSTNGACNFYRDVLDQFPYWHTHKHIHTRLTFRDLWRWKESTRFDRGFRFWYPVAYYFQIVVLLCILLPTQLIILSLEVAYIQHNWVYIALSKTIYYDQTCHSKR